jgi:hypothetical protein
MQPNKKLQGMALLAVMALFLWIFGALLVDTWRATQPVKPGSADTAIIPILSGGLGLVLALALGVDPSLSRTGPWHARLKAAFSLANMLTASAVVYLVAGLAGVVVWQEKGDVTPDLVTAVSLTVVGYAAATLAALARP